MCGLNGIFAYNAAAGAPSRTELVATRDYMEKRGPDGYGEWWTPDRRLGLGHRRLSIIDLHERSNQPMHSEDGRYTVVFNGEIYNFPALRLELEAHGCRFRTTSDTEVLIHLFALYGDQMLRRLRGMFAFAIWDNRERKLFLARDPYGIKPLYIADDGWTFRFASQVKALLAGGGVSRDPEPAGMVGFHLWGSVPEPFTLYREIRALPAGHFQWVDEAGPRPAKSYANIAANLAAGEAVKAPASELRSRIQAAVRDSVRAHLISDVEVGVFLSAGVDSGALLGLMREAGLGRVKAVTLAFNEFTGTQEDEAPLAAEVARRYGAEHVVRWVDEAEFRADLPAIFEAMDQPSIDGVNTWFVAKATREAGLKVALSGVGGDELLAGYPSFRQVPQWVAWMRIPSAVPGLGRAARVLGSALGLARRHPKGLGLLQYAGDYEGAYFLRRGLFLPFELKTQMDPTLVELGLRRLNVLARIRDQALTPRPRSNVAKVSALESSWYLRHQLLRDTDWAGMAHSLEIRTPLVDIDLLKAVAPMTPHLHASLGKSALANAPAPPLDASISDRPKTGFVVPTGRWSVSTGASPSANKGQASRGWARQVFAHSIAAPIPAPAVT